MKKCCFHFLIIYDKGKLAGRTKQKSWNGEITRAKIRIETIFYKEVMLNIFVVDGTLGKIESLQGFMELLQFKKVKKQMV